MSPLIIQIFLNEIFARNISPSISMTSFPPINSVRHTEGSGLGLTIARSLTELQGGSMAVATDGDLFKVTLTFPMIQDTEGELILDEQKE